MKEAAAADKECVKTTFVFQNEILQVDQSATHLLFYSNQNRPESMTYSDKNLVLISYPVV